MMLVLFKKRVFLGCVAVLLCTFLAGVLYQVQRPRDVFLPTSNKTILIDAGHDA